MYHYGLTVKEYRELKGLTQSELAEKWIKSDGSIGVSVDYVSSIENGRKGISDQKVLRSLCDILDIPLWKLGLSEHNPFEPDVQKVKGGYLYPEMLDAIDGLIRTCWHVRRTQPLPVLLGTISYLSGLMSRVTQSVGSVSDKRLLNLQAQVLRLEAITAGNLKKYDKALELDYRMLEIAKETEDKATLALAHLAIGTELDRRSKHHEAVMHLEQGRDVSFRSSRPIMTLMNAYLARAYASSGDKERFLRTIDVAEGLARDLNGTYGDGQDYVYHRLTGVLAEKSYGLLGLNMSNESLATIADIEDEMQKDNNWWLHAWLPLDYAHAYMINNDIEGAVKAGISFYNRVRVLQAPHAIDRVIKLIKEMNENGYGDIKAVKEFEDMVKYQ